MATKKSSVKKKTRSAKTVSDQIYGPFVPVLIGVFFALSFVFLAMAYWRYG